MLLIDRSKRPFEVTPAGQLFSEGCRDLLERYRAIEDQVLRMRDIVAGAVRVAAIYSVGLPRMERFVRQFEERYPDTRVQVEYLHPNEVYQQVLNDEADLGVVSFPQEKRQLTSIPWQEEPFVIVVPPGHELAGRGSAVIGELQGEELIGFTDDLTIRKEVERRLKQAGVSVHVVQRFDNIDSIKRAVEDGLGLALLPLPTVQREAKAGSLAVVRLSDVHWTRPLGLIHKRHKQLGSAARVFLDQLLQDQATEPASVSGAARPPAARRARAVEVRKRRSARA